jgi:serine/threonine protein kinase
MELCSMGSLREVLLDKNLQLTEVATLRLAIEIADGMAYLHTQSPSIIHRDLKSLNIFIHRGGGGNLTAKIGDWGSARVHLAGSSTMTHGHGTACWIAPEVIKFSRASKKSDVYGFGIILWEMASRREVFEGMYLAQIIHQVANEGLRPELVAGNPWESVMVECWAAEPNDRPDFIEVLRRLNELMRGRGGAM